MGRDVPEWIGKTPGARVPPRVRLRVFETHWGRCHISGRRIQAGEPWECDHVVALCNGGENRESNLKPALLDKHREKTTVDVAIKARDYRKAAKHRGIKLRSGNTLQSRGFDKRPPQHTASRPIERDE